MLGLQVASHAFPSSSAPYRSAANLSAIWWARQIEKNGLLDEYFAGQKSFCATAYSTMTAAAWYLLTDQKDESVRAALVRALNALVGDRNRPESANQTIVARLAFDLAAEMGIVTGAAPFYPQSIGPLGYSEYGGFDLGYSLKCLDLCAMGLAFLRTAERRDAYVEFAQNLLRSVHISVVQFTFSPYLGSRGNPHLLLGGLTLFSKSGCGVAAEILLQLKDPKRFPSLVKAECCDDKYLTFFHLNSLMLECFAAGPTPPVSIGSFALGEFEVPRLNEGLHRFDEGGLLFFKSKSVRACISLQRGGLLHSEVLGHCESNLGNLIMIKGQIWKPSDAPVRATVARHEDDHYSIEVPIYSQPMKQKVLLSQNWLFSFALKVALTLPVFGRVLRNQIYLKMNKKSDGVLIGKRMVNLGPFSVDVRDFLDVDVEAQYSVREWTFTDGHATRMFQHPRPAFEMEDFDGH